MELNRLSIKASLGMSILDRTKYLATQVYMILRSCHHLIYQKFTQILHNCTRPPVWFTRLYIAWVYSTDSIIVAYNIESTVMCSWSAQLVSIALISVNCLLHSLVNSVSGGHYSPVYTVPLGHITEYCTPWTQFTSKCFTPRTRIHLWILSP